MNRFNYLLALLLCVGIFACKSQKEEISLEGSTVKELSTEVTVRNTGTATTLEKYMQWTSFIAGKVFTEKQFTRTEVKNLLDPTTKTVYLETLIGETAQAHEFKNFFKQYLKAYIKYGGKPSEEEDTPPRPIMSTKTSAGNKSNLNPSGTILISDLALENTVNSLLHIILEENCLELYFPNSLADPKTETVISSTAHPLTNAAGNEGYKRVVITLSTGAKINRSIDVMIDPNYVNNHNDIIVARPFRDAFIPHCDYNEYALLHFPDFLD